MIPIKSPDSNGMLCFQLDILNSTRKQADVGIVSYLSRVLSSTIDSVYEKSNLSQAQHNRSCSIRWYDVLV